MQDPYVDPLDGPQLYDDLADWFHLLTAPADYADEAEFIHDLLSARIVGPLHSMLELGSGGGNIASHLKRDLRLTLTDISLPMLEISQRLNPECEHIAADMRTVRLGRTFDAVLAHDAIMYMTGENDLVAALATAHAHLDPGGAVIVLPDHVAETFEPAVETGGSDAVDGSGRGVRYISWSHSPAPGASVQHTDYVLLLRAPDGSVEVVHDRHTTGIFARDTWSAAFARAGFAPPAVHRDPWRRDVFIARKQ